MVTRKTNPIAFIGILITAWLVVFATQVEAQTTDEQKQALIGEWRGVWLGTTLDAILVIHEIDTANAKARCTYTTSALGAKKHPVLANFTPGPNPKIEFKIANDLSPKAHAIESLLVPPKEANDYQFVLRKKVLKGAFRGTGMEAAGHSTSSTIQMEKYPKK